MKNNNLPVNRRNIRPFVKWAGGKGRLISLLDSQLPIDFGEQENVIYVEPFVGGGAMLFHMLINYPNIKRVIINDINTDLIHCYRQIKENPEVLIRYLKEIEYEFYHSSENTRSTFYYQKRIRYNSGTLTNDERSAYFIFFNQTCFNGLYRENLEGHFNVPFGKMISPKICNEEVIMADHQILQKVEIYCGDYNNIKHRIYNGNAFVYIDPPYRPLSKTSNFKGYSKSTFGDSEQEALKIFCDNLSERGCKILISNSYSVEKDGTSYFDNLYQGYSVDKILAHRFINAHIGKRRNKETELLIRNYDNPRIPLVIPELNFEFDE